MASRREQAVDTFIDGIRSTLYGRSYDVVQERKELRKWIVSLLEKIDAIEREVREASGARMGADLREDSDGTPRSRSGNYEVVGSKLRGRFGNGPVLRRER